MANPNQDMEELLLRVYDRAVDDQGKKATCLRLAGIVMKALQRYAHGTDESWTPHLTGSMVTNTWEKNSDVDIYVQVQREADMQEVVVQAEEELVAQNDLRNPNNPDFIDIEEEEPDAQGDLADQFENLHFDDVPPKIDHGNELVEAVKEARKGNMIRLNAFTISEIDAYLRNEIAAIAEGSEAVARQREKEANPDDPLAGFDDETFVDLLKEFDAQGEFMWTEVYVQNKAAKISVMAVLYTNVQHPFYIDILFGRRGETSCYLARYADNKVFVGLTTIVKFVLNAKGLYGSKYGYINGTGLAYMVLAYLAHQRNVQSVIEYCASIIEDRRAPANVTTEDVRNYLDVHTCDILADWNLYNELVGFLRFAHGFDQRTEILQIYTPDRVPRQTDAQGRRMRVFDPVLEIDNSLGHQDNCAHRVSQEGWTAIRNEFSYWANKLSSPDQQRSVRLLRGWATL